MHVALWDGNAWDILAIEDSIDCSSVSLDFDAEGNPAVSYAKRDMLLYSFWEFGSWETALELDDGWMERYVRGTCLSFSPEGYPGIAFTRDSSVMYAQRKAVL